MWITKLVWRHDCMLGNRCRKYNVTSIGFPLDMLEEKGTRYYSHFDTLLGREEDIRAFVADLKKDKRAKEVEFEGNTLFFLAALPKDEKIPTTHYNRKIFFMKPVVVDSKGYEHWEIASWKKEHLMEFIASTKRDTEKLEGFKVQKIVKTKLTDVYFPHVMPILTKGQKKALELAYKNGYYDFPRKAELKQLAAISGISLSTFREHLRRAEKRIMPDIIRASSFK
jgi:predicted DNA binding protein